MTPMRFLALNIVLGAASAAAARKEQLETDPSDDQPRKKVSKSAPPAAAAPKAWVWDNEKDLTFIRLLVKNNFIDLKWKQRGEFWETITIGFQVSYPDAKDRAVRERLGALQAAYKQRAAAAAAAEVPPLQSAAIQEIDAFLGKLVQV